MKRWFSLLLLLGALLGLMGQEAAFASVPSMQMPDQANQSMAMSADCAQMMGLAKQKQQPAKPCQGMTLDCIAKMGCALPLALLPPLAPGVSQEFRVAIPPQMPVAPLVGRDIGPEPEPPTHLG